MFYLSSRGLKFRHPLARLLAGVIGLAIALLLVTVGLVAFAALAVGGLIFLLINAFRSPKRPRTQGHAASSQHAPPPGIIEGEFTVVNNERTRHHPE